MENEGYEFDEDAAALDDNVEAGEAGNESNMFQCLLCDKFNEFDRNKRTEFYHHVKGRHQGAVVCTVVTCLHPSKSESAAICHEREKTGHKSKPPKELLKKAKKKKKNKGRR